MQQDVGGSYRVDIAPGEFPADLRALLLSNYDVTDQPVTSVHLHDFLELGYCHEGNGIFIIGRKILPFQQGDAVIINNREAHCAQSLRGTTSRWSWVYLDVASLLSNFTIDFDLIDYSHFWGSHFNNIISPTTQPELSHVIQCIVAELRDRHPQYQRVIRALVLYLMTLLHRKMTSNRHPADHDPLPHAYRIKPALEMMGSRYSEKISLSEMASVCNMSIPHFRRIFKKAIGKNPLEYLIQLRLTMACVELRSTDKSAERVAADTGFPTFSCFLRKFKASYGTTPHIWRSRT